MRQFSDCFSVYKLNKYAFTVRNFFETFAKSDGKLMNLGKDKTRTHPDFEIDT